MQVTAQLQGRESQQRGWQAGGVHGRRVGALVLVEVVLSAEPLAAELAAERPVTRVNARVTGELLVPGEPLVARFTFERTLACKREREMATLKIIMQQTQERILAAISGPDENLSDSKDRRHGFEM